ncbi:MAG TPA: O-antigen ligase family protein [Blastocatellia bacterium]|nr:O-antigen ligase family protein [Blastocatellia bacterium]
MKARLEKAVIAGLLAAVVFTALAHGAVESWAVAIFELIIVALLLLWGAKMITEGNIKISIPNLAWPLIALLIFGILQSISITGDDGRRISLSLDVEATRATTLVLFFLVVCFIMAASLFQSRERLNLLANFLIIYGAALAAFALVQYFTWNGRFYWLRPLTAHNATPFGPFVNRNHFAGYMELLAPLPVALAITKAARRDARLFHLFAAVIMSLAAIVSLSRGGMISLASELAFITVLGRRGREGNKKSNSRLIPFSPSPLLILTLAVAAGIIWIGPGLIVDRLAQTNRSDGQVETFYASRGWIWRETLSIIEANPISGVGLGAYETAFPIYSGDDGMKAVGKSFAVDRAHNDYLQILSEGGIIAGAIVLWFILVFFRSVRQAMRSSDPLVRGFALGGSGGIVGMLVHSLFDFNLQLPSNALLFLLLASIVSQLAALERERAAPPEVNLSRPLLVTGV